MKVKIHTLSEYLLVTTAVAPKRLWDFRCQPRHGFVTIWVISTPTSRWTGTAVTFAVCLNCAIMLGQAALMGPCNRANVLITAGAAEANYLSIMQLLQPGERIVIETPGWPQAEVLARAKGADIVRLAREEADGWRLPLDRLAAAVTPAGG